MRVIGKAAVRYNFCQDAQVAFRMTRVLVNYWTDSRQVTQWICPKNKLKLVQPLLHPAVYHHLGSVCSWKVIGGNKSSSSSWAAHYTLFSILSIQPLTVTSPHKGRVSPSRWRPLVWTELQGYYLYEEKCEKSLLWRNANVHLVFAQLNAKSMGNIQLDQPQFASLPHQLITF